MMDLGYNASSLLREYTGVISEWRDVDSIISIDCKESGETIGVQGSSPSKLVPRGKLDAGLCLAFSSALTPVDVPSPVSMKKN
ncbi:unnamed protein product [Sphenostylis stenocarpa]|uniref:Uncharacterized protein n=1 Tax=Sphenostylis stenocarpa TaxID=92480 RepID=A0AA86SWZ9_9FABA|nr:unnamed protein product [Sphenostylis stenocarpa]